MENTMRFKEYENELEVIFEGEIDHQLTLNYRELLIHKIEKERYEKVVLNFKKVTFIDSSGIGMVLGRYNQVNQYGGKLYFSELSDPTKRLFELSGLLKLIEIKEVFSHV